MPTFETDWSVLVDEVQQGRFTGRTGDTVERWCLRAYAEIWHAADWPWKFTEITAIVASSDNVAVLQPDGDVDADLWDQVYQTFGVNRIMNVYDSEGSELRYLSQREFNAVFLGSTDTATPEAWTDKWPSTNGIEIKHPTIVVGPYADQATTLIVRVELKPALADPDDRSPAIPFEWQEAIVYGAMSIGLRLENDPTWMSVEQMFREAIVTLVNASLPSSLHENRSYGGRDNYVDGGW
jgi:hypothetical protein